MFFFSFSLGCSQWGPLYIKESAISQSMQCLQTESRTRSSAIDIQRPAQANLS
uniref:Uncharacterized protein n=1 Tax=Anguilla anguilla TaxID=7936 RepID=A0A0E9WRF5_ANGAN